MIFHFLEKYKNITPYVFTLVFTAFLWAIYGQLVGILALISLGTANYCSYAMVQKKQQLINKFPFFISSSGRSDICSKASSRLKLKL